MKKKILFASFLMIGMFYQVYAATGNASDGFEGFLVIIGFLLIITGILYLIDYFKNNGKKLICSMVAFLKKISKSISALLNKTDLERFDKAYLS